MLRHALSRLALLSSLVTLTGCAALFSPIRQGTQSLFARGSVDIAVTDGELPELGRFTLREGGTYDGWAMEDGTNASVDGSHAVFESDQGWQVIIDHFLHSESYYPVQILLRYEPEDGTTTYGFDCTSDDLVTTDERFSGTLDCRKSIPSEPPPFRLTVEFEATP